MKWSHFMVECPLVDLAHTGSVNNKVNILQREKETNESKADELGKRVSKSSLPLGLLT